MKNNISKIYVLPILCQWININRKNKMFVKNTYLFTNRDMRIGKFYVECNFDYKDINFIKNESIFTDNELYVKSYSIGENVLYEYKIPKEYGDDVLKLVNGKYSELSEDYKLIITEYWTEMFGHIPGFINNNIKQIKHVFDKSEILRQKLQKELNVFIKKGSELKDSIDIQSETFEFKEENKITLQNISDIF